MVDWGTPEEVTPPAAEPLLVDELKLWCKMDFDDDDATFKLLIKAARKWFEKALDRQLVTATWRVKGWAFPPREIELPYPPLRSVGSITYKDASLATQTLSSSAYDVITAQTPGVVQPRDGYSWPTVGTNPTAVTITFDAGYGTPAAVPEDVKVGISLLAAHWYANREAVAAGAMTQIPLAVDSIVAAARAYRF